MACAGCKKKRGKKTEEVVPLSAPREEFVQEENTINKTTPNIVQPQSTPSPSFQSPKVLPPLSR